MVRPRSIQAHRKVIESAAKLFAERGIDATSMDAIAEASGVSKATIYKHWPDKDRLCLEIMGHLYGLDEERPVFDSGDFRADMIAQLRYQPAEDRKAMRERIIPHFIAYSSRNEAFGTAWRSRALEPARVALADLIRRGEKRGILKSGIEPDIAIALLLGPMIYQHVFVTKAGRKAPEGLETHVADAFLAAFRRTVPQVAPRKPAPKRARAN